MTRDEALDFISRAIKDDVDVAKMYEALMVFQQPEQTCEDAISRAEAIKAMNDIEQEDIELYGCHIPEGFDGKRAIEALHSLPSVALSAEPCKDAVSREAVLDIFAKNADAIRSYSVAWEKISDLPPVNPQPKTEWIPVSERLPKTDNENSINSFNVLLWVKNKTHPEREAQIYLGKLMHVDGDDGSGNFWGIETKPCDWTIWGWSYINEPEVIAWMPLPEPFEPQESEGVYAESNN